MFFLRICTIFCMSEAVTISNVSRILQYPHRRLKRPQNQVFLWGIFAKHFFILLKALAAIVPWCHRGDNLRFRLRDALTLRISAGGTIPLSARFRWIASVANFGRKSAKSSMSLRCFRLMEFMSSLSSPLVLPVAQTPVGLSTAEGAAEGFTMQLG